MCVRVIILHFELLFCWSDSVMHLQIQAQNIRVGNIVWLRENDEVPCDLVLVGTSDPQGLCYIEVTIQINIYDNGAYFSFLFLINVEIYGCC